MYLAFLSATLLLNAQPTDATIQDLVPSFDSASNPNGDKLRIGIIGGGASGLAALKIIQESKPFQEGRFVQDREVGIDAVKEGAYEL